MNEIVQGGSLGHGTALPRREDRWDTGLLSLAGRIAGTRDCSPSQGGSLGHGTALPRREDRWDTGLLSLASLISTWSSTPKVGMTVAEMSMQALPVTTENKARLPHVAIDNG